MADEKALTPTTNVDFKGKISENFHDEYWVGAVIKNILYWLYLGDGITNVTPKYTDKKKTAAYMDGGGVEKNTITGVTSSYDVTGDRSKGNPAQDFIASLKQKTGASRNNFFRKNSYMENQDGSFTLISSEYGMASYSDIDDGGGAADDNGGFKVTAQYNQSPKMVDASDLQQLDNILHQTPCQNATIVGSNIEQPQADGKIAIYKPDLSQSDGDVDVESSKAALLDEAREIAGSVTSPVITTDNVEPDTTSDKPANPSDVNSEAMGNGAKASAK
ncbi:phage tail tube protein [Companilactobacillus alimentarius]|uniref:phage tail tube protein n=1 Tax=Companilactobacillus alimentarius TaxID=1602 RepID=UPI0028B93285|nr:hypothetical protein [Companilactobacillus alimentarius]MDT6953217.1 hypothetical protein [Companilactobacillus alimentarius]